MVNDLSIRKRKVYKIQGTDYLSGEGLEWGSGGTHRYFSNISVLKLGMADLHTLYIYYIYFLFYQMTQNFLKMSTLKSI